MSEATSAPAEPTAPAGPVPLREIFLTFLVIGATSFGGGVVAYLRNSLVRAKKWLDEDQFLEALEISQTLPGLNATNMSVIVGDRLRGPLGAVVAFLGMTMPGAAMMTGLGVVYALHKDHSVVSSVLVGVGAAAVGLLASVTIQVGRKQLEHVLDLSIVAATILMISVFHISMPIVLLVLGPIAVFIDRPHPKRIHLRRRHHGHDIKPAD
ncbi:MAG: chromate transporter [Alphaproteobacteria bacterium]|nr:chromate transporter [Alphaproteobacteria bacterium]